MQMKEGFIGQMENTLRDLHNNKIFFISNKSQIQHAFLD